MITFVPYFELWAGVRRLQLKRQQQNAKLVTPVVCLHPLTYREKVYGTGIVYRGRARMFSTETVLCGLCCRVLSTRELPHLTT